MKPRAPIIHLRDGEVLYCVIPSSKHRLRRHMWYSYYALRNELFQWAKDARGWGLCRVITGARKLAKLGHFIRMPICPKCFKTIEGHNVNNCEKDYRRKKEKHPHLSHFDWDQTGIG